MPARIRRVPPLLVGLSLLALLIAARPAGAASPTPIPGHWIVLLKSTATSATVARLKADTGVQPRLRYTHAIKGFSAKLSSSQVRDLRDDPAVVSVTPDYPVHADAFVPLAPGEPTPPTGVRRIVAATTTTVRQASSANVAIIDTGIDLTHPDLNAVAGTNCINPGTSPQDDDGHGSHVAGIIGALNNGSGVVGVAPGTKEYAVKVLDSTGSGTTSQVICGIDWVTANAAALGIKVANMSLGGQAPSLTACPNTSDPEHKAICNSVAAGVTYTVAAGNSNTSFEGTSGWFFGSPPQAPAVYPEVLTVTAMSDSDGQPGGTGGHPSCRTSEGDDVRASFTNYASTSAGQAHTIAGPGVCITSTYMNGGYATLSGTSMASPHIAGAVALCLGDGSSPGPCAGMTPAQIIQKMRSDAQAHTQSVPSFGFTGDPSHPSGSGYLGYLAWEGNAPTAPPANPPTVTTGTTSNLGATTATLTGTINPNGAPLSYHFDYGQGTGSTYSSSTPTQTLPAGTTTVNVSAGLSGLTPNTGYHYRLVADNGGGPVSGGDQQFTTNPPPPASVTTGSANPVAATTATLGGSVNPNGFPVSYHFDYGTDPNNYTSSTPTQTLPAGTTAVSVSANVTGLAPSTTYHFRLVADNGGGPVSGGDKQFTTSAPPPPPTVATTGPSNVGASGATVGGTINPNGSAVSYHFDYGTDPSSYGSSTPTQTLAAGSSTVAVTAQLSGLNAATTYHYRLVADNGGGPVSGGDQQFTTTTAPPAPTNAAPSSVTIETGSASSTNPALLAAADGNSMVVASAFSFSPFGYSTSWYGTFTNLPASPASLAVSYTGSNTTACSQTVQIFRWSDSTWVTLDTRSVGPTVVAIANLAAPGAAAQYVSNGSARVRVRCSPSSFSTFSASADLLRLTYG